jgi:putative phosphoribosyl transferase
MQGGGKMMNYPFLFLDRKEAGRKLAAKLLDEPFIEEASRDELVVLSIPKGGVGVGAMIARVLGCAHDVVVAQKIGFPGHHEEAGIGAMAEDGTVVLNQWITQEFSRYITQALEQTRKQVEALIHKFRQGRPLDLHSKVVIIVDDGIATGETVKAIITWITTKALAQRPKKVLIAVPVASPRVAKEFEKLVDKFICLATPKHFGAVSQFYWDFDQLSDEEVVALLGQSTPVPLSL